MFKLSSNKEKYDLNKKFFEMKNTNKKEQKINIFPEYKNMIFKSLGRNAVPLVPIFQKKGNEKTQVI